MSIADITVKTRWTLLQVMKSPAGSQERRAWITIVRDLEVLKNQMTTAGTVAMGQTVVR